ncbi:hypothetical protein ACS0Y3_16895 [Burkholderia gladioli]|uniref:hypothetical protein n=1 Tax=Burkholderia gladioli TaxID=28095 RepID=UPI003F7AFFC7
MTQLWIQANDEWFLLRQSEIVPYRGVPALSEPGVVLFYASKAQTGAMEVEGRRKHLGAIIEHRLASTGAVYGSTSVALHYAGKRQRGYHVLYSAVPSDDAEFMARWVDEQHVPVVSVAFMTWMWRQVSENEAVLCQVGTSTFFLGRQDGRVFHLVVKAFSEAMPDVRASWEALAARIRGMRTRGESWLDESVLSVRWCPACAYRESEWSASREVDDVNAVFGSLFPELVFVDAVGTELGSRVIVSALPGKVSARVAAQCSPEWGRVLAWMTASYERQWMALAWVVSAVVLYGAVRFYALSVQTDSEAMQISVEAAQQERAINAMSGKDSMPPQYEEWARQITSQKHTLEQVDVNQIFADVGDAAQVAGVTIVRIHTISPADTAKSNRAPGSNKRSKSDDLTGGIGVEGLLTDNGLTSANDQLSRFVAALRTKGYTMQAVPTETSQVTASLAGRLFAYVMREPNRALEPRA